MPNFLSGRKDARDARPMSVSQLTGRIRGVLESNFGEIHVEGEIGDWTAGPSGHAYFTLKDEFAVISCVLWASKLARLGFAPRKGIRVEARGQLSLYEKRGQYQLSVDTMSLAGEGALWQRFEALKAKLDAEGLFAAELKRPIPRYPRCVGIVTSPTGAVIHDIINVATRRAPGLPLLLHPARVQGDGAAAEVVAALRTLAGSGRVDAVIVARGGGSMEDLWEFNSEALARAVRACPVPVISAVGHETDFTICDFVSDLRAPTPSAAAEIVTAGFLDLRDGVRLRLDRARRALEATARDRRRHLEGLVNSHALRLPELRLRELQQRADAALERIPELVHRRAERLRLRLERAAGGLEGHNPALILKKGYAIVRRAKDGKPLLDAAWLKRNQAIDVELRDGTKRAIVTDDAAPDLFS